MVSHPRPPLSRLNIPGPHSLNMQQPVGFDPRSQSMFSPGLPTTIQGFHPPYQVHGQSALQTPMQPVFPPQPPGAPSRPSYAQHRVGQVSIAQLAAAGIHPPNGMPMAPLGQGFHSQIPPFGGQGPGFQRNRRTPSVSFGGPPKAVLGGPNRKVSPLPPASADTTPAPATVKGRKAVVKFPQETFVGDDAVPTVIRAPWARTPLPLAEVPEQPVLRSPELVTAEAYPTDSDRLYLPNTVDVFLPGKSAWDALRKLDIEEKLQKLGVEPGSMNLFSYTLGPHGRAASISSPADSALLYFKLNKLQQSQTASASNSLTTSPQPPFNVTSSPNQVLPRMQQNSHGHSMSLVQPQIHHSPFFTPPPAFNPFGPNATLGDSPGPTDMPLDNIHAPQGRVPVTASSLALPPSLSRPDSRPDFARGFGLDVPEEEEPDEHVAETAEALQEIDDVFEADAGGYEQDGEQVEEQDGTTTVAQSRLHSRHVSNALSFGSVGGGAGLAAVNGLDIEPARIIVGDPEIDDLDQDAIGEWTGSDDVRLSDMSDDEESIGEWSNPSDEERARQERVQRRALHRNKREVDGPRWIPNFPRPPDNTVVGGMPGAEDDIISNPSEEGHVRSGRHGVYLGVEYTRPSSSPSSTRNRPLPPLPHSRVASGQLSASGYDPALAHSRAPSQPNAHVPAPSMTSLTQSLAGSAGPSLNPKAKPFVFGATSRSGSWAPVAFGGNLEPPPAAPRQPTFGHAHMPSFGKPLNAAAVEFKPGQFTFRPPPAAPKIEFPPPSPRPLPQPPTATTPARAMQGREKRQRRGSSGSFDGKNEGGKDSMSSFRFPPPGDSPNSIRRSAPTTPRFLGERRQSMLNASAQPFTFSGFSSAIPFVPQAPPAPLSRPPVPSIQGPECDVLNSSTPETETGVSPVRGVPVSSSTKQKRAPIPLDFTHPNHSNTVPAGLFKAVANGDERTRRTVRSRLGSREIEHMPRPSLDDLAVPSISRKPSRPRLATEPMHPRDLSGEKEDIFSPAVQRGASLPDVNHSAAESSLSNVSFPTVNLTKRFESQHLEQKLEALVDDKIASLRLQVSSSLVPSSMDAKMDELLSLYRMQLDKDAVRGLQDGEMDIDARGEIDFEVIKEVIEEGNKSARAVIQEELADAIRRLEEKADQQNGSLSDVLSIIEQLTDRTIEAVKDTVTQGSRLSDVGLQWRLSSEFERETLIREFTSALTPILSTLRPEAVDYDHLTQQLSQAVKPHISQLIDLASDKRETASLIVNSILPLLPSHSTPVFDTQSIATQLTSEIRRVIAPVDAHEIKEQVADLVVERLDSRLAVRDRTFNVDSVTGKVNESIACLLEPLQQVASTVDNLAEGQMALTSQNDGLASSHKDMVTLLADLPLKLANVMEAVDATKTELLSRPVTADESIVSSDAISHIHTAIDQFADGQKAMSIQTGELLSQQHEVLGRLSALPEALSVATSVLQTAHAEFASSRDASKHDLDEIRRLKTQNSDIQVQLAKARGAHGQVRVEKDNLVEKIQTVEAERDRYRSQIEDMHTAAQAAASSAFETRNVELEDALSQALARLKASDVMAQTNQERIAELQKINDERTLEIQNLKSKVDTLELQAALAARDKHAAVEAHKTLQKEHDRVTSQQSHWDDLHRATEQIEVLTTLIGQANNEEVEELKRIRDRSNKLENEHAALQKRMKDQESKVANSERAATIARQSLAQAQQRASEWERRAKEHESELELTRMKLDQADQTHAQLDTDYSLLQLRLEEQEADDRLAKDRENNLRNQVFTLESLVTRLEADIVKAKAFAVPLSKYSNGQTLSPPRPDSRASTAYGVSRSGTPVAKVNGSNIRSNTPPTSSVWDSIHAPHSTPKARQTSHRSQIPSPTPSTVSLTPTQGDDGWWS